MGKQQTENKIPQYRLTLSDERAGREIRTLRFSGAYAIIYSLAALILFVGLIYPPVGMILGSLAGAFLAELLMGGKDTATSLKSAFGAFMGFIFGTGLKLICAGVMLFYIIVYAF